MAEVAWTEEGPSTPPKKKIPTWVWFCGSGCLAMVVLGIIATVFFVGYVKDAIDPEKQWVEIAKILPYDERPEHLKPVFGNQLLLEQYNLHDDKQGLQITLQHHKGEDGAKARRDMFQSDTPVFPEDLAVMKFQDLKTGVVDIQGRDVPVLRMRMEFAGMAKRFIPKEAQDQLGAMLFADITREGDPGLLLLEVIRDRGTDPISDDELRELLKPFHVGPNR